MKLYSLIFQKINYLKMLKVNDVLIWLSQTKVHLFIQLGKYLYVPGTVDFFFKCNPDHKYKAMIQENKAQSVTGAKGRKHPCW